MEEALKLRKAARDSFSRICKEMALTGDGSAIEASLQELASENGTHRLSKLLKRQRRLLDSVASVIKLACDGEQILDSVEICQNRNLDPLQYDITVETDFLFQSVVRKPSNKLRAFMERGGNVRFETRKSSTKLPTSEGNSKDADLQRFARTFIRKIVAQPIDMLLSVGNTILGAYLKQDDHSDEKQRFRVSILRILMYLSDCFRYGFDYEKSHKIAELMLFSDPSDAEAYFRMAMNEAVMTICAQDITPFFHYCVFLDNRNVDINHVEAKVVQRHVMYVKDKFNVSGSDSVRREAVVKIIDAAWAMLEADVKDASLKVRDEGLWKAVKEFVNITTRKEVLHMIGALIFSHYRSTAKKNGKGADSQWDLPDYALSRFVTVLAETVADKLKKVKIIIRNRKKNRRRAMQKKRRKDTANVQGDGGEVIAFAALKHIGSIEEQVPHLGGLSFIAHYWASREVIVGQHNTRTMANALQSLKTVVCELRSINELTSTLKLSKSLETKPLNSPRTLPPLPEDVTFCNLSLCERLRMFQHVCIYRATFESLFENGPPNLEETVRNESLATYTSFAQATATRHMKAFSLKCAKHEKLKVDDLGFPATLSVVATAIRKHRISILISKLEKFGDERIGRLLGQELRVGEAQQSEIERDASSSPPLPGQKPSQERGGVQDEQGTIAIDMLMTKRRRIIGSCTPGHSKAQYAVHDVLESDPAAPGSFHLSERSRGASLGKVVGRNAKVTEIPRKDADGCMDRFSKEPSSRQPVDAKVATTSNEYSPKENQSTTFRLLQLMYPAHTNSVPCLCCETAHDTNWRKPASELPYINIASFPAIAGRDI